MSNRKYIKIEHFRWMPANHRGKGNECSEASGTVELCPVCRNDMGRIFGGWAKCIHGWLGMLAELETKAVELRSKINAAQYAQYIKTGDECYIANMTPDGMRGLLRDLGDNEQAVRLHNRGIRTELSSLADTMTEREYGESSQGWVDG